ncbi:hypothetical protein [Halobacillus halophilus]|uniref:hypothetical protein n=1 Tax=Halobacillus halophilus TaxID=1570 RepID=UPI001CD6D94E|nr:hypothetical protein [Halobacillus halophilus]MCA1010346.1 hypothetical protein [Halobacillus halophilus]
MQTQSVSTLYNVCPLCHGSGKYKEYDDGKANLIVDHYQRVNYANETLAWKMAIEETSYVKECSKCHGKGNVLNKEGERMYKQLQQYA